MAAHGFIHEELDIKILILYILKRLSGPVDEAELFGICRCDDGVGYFDYTECLNDLIEAGHINSTEDGLRISEKGRRNIKEVESALPYSVRSKAGTLIDKADEKIRRSGLVKASIKKENSGWTVAMSMSDGIGQLIEMKLLCADEAQAKLIRRYFKSNAEKCYNDIINMMSEKE